MTTIHSLEKFLAWSGRNNIDPRAPFGYEIGFEEGAEDTTSSSFYMEALKLVRQLQKVQNGEPFRLSFYKLEDGGTKNYIPVSTTYQRQAWIVGVAANPWRFVERSHSPFGRNRLAHWGVYIKPVTADNSQSYRIFGMNFHDKYKGKIILEDAWGTSGADGKGEWKKLVNKNDFQFVDINDPILGTANMFFSFEEFVLNLQWILRCWVHERRGLPFESEILAPPSEHDGEVYRLFQSNCQHFSRKVMQSLRELGWEDRERQARPFILGELEQSIRSQLKADAQKERSKELWSLAIHYRAKAKDDVEG